MKLAKCVFTVILVLFALSQIVHSQQSAPIEVKANILVLDSNNQLINDVKQEDIKIFEDGVEQKITAFTKKEPVLNVGLIIDNTGSMKYHLKNLAFAGNSFLINLQSQDEAFVVRFVSNDKIEIMQEWSSDKEKFKKALSEMFIEGGQSAIIDAVYISVKKIQEREQINKTKRYALILLTDGEERDSYYKESELYELFKGSDVQIFSIAFAEQLDKKIREKSLEFLNRMSLISGGVAYFSEKEKRKTEDWIFEKIKSILLELRSQYIIGYTSTNPLSDGTPRKLTVQIADNEKGEKRTGIIRESFIVPKK